ncbi:DUF333 domain-containing protein [Kerstersia similis]|uniref:DUF333 domain-containing protein n=1 Tax=Kerstersia similis TaxID=206505 RepID=UPI0039EF0BF9
MPGVSWPGLCAGMGAAICAAVLAGCGVSGGVAGGANAAQAVSLPNPASVYCEEKGGTVTVESTPAGQAGICLLPDGRRIDEWALYRRDFPEVVEIDKP